MTSQGLALVGSVAVGRILGAKSFGELGIIQSTVGIFGVLAGMGLGMTAAKYIAELRASNPYRTGRIVTLSLRAAIATSAIAASLLFIFARPVVQHSLRAPHLESELRIGSALLLLNGMTATQAGVLTGLEAFKEIAKINLIRNLAVVPMSVLGGAIWGITGVLWALVASAGVSWLAGRAVLGRTCVRQGIPPTAHGVWQERRILWEFATPAFLSATMVSPVNWLANVLLVNQPGGYRQMGIFTAANQWRMAVAFLASILMQPTLPMLSNLQGVEKCASYRRVLCTTLFLVLALTTLAAGVIGAGSCSILSAYGDDFLSSAATLRLLASATIFSCAAGLIGNAIASKGRMWTGFLLNLLWAVTFMLLVVRLVPQYGAAGLAAATLGSYILHAVSAGAYARRALF